MLSSVAWRIKELEERPKLGMMKEIVPLDLELSCAVLKRKRDRRMMIKLRGHGSIPDRLIYNYICAYKLNPASSWVTGYITEVVIHITLRAEGQRVI